MSGEPWITFIVPVLDDAERLRRCLRSVADNSGRYELVVVDNGSTDGSDRIASGMGATLIHSPALTVSGLRNAGARIAHGEVLAFVDADHEISPMWVPCAQAALDNPRSVMVGAPCTNQGQTWVQRAYDGLRRRSAFRRKVGWLGSGNLAIRRSVFFDVGGFDETLQTCEDVDLCRRIRAAGWDIVADPALASVHLGDPASLSEIFWSELWRGRNNLLVSLRRPFQWRDVMSAMIPVGTLSLLTTTAVALSSGAERLAIVSAGLTGGLVIQRAIRICANRATWRPLAVAQSLAVAFPYEIARALALVTRARYRTRRSSPVRPQATA